MMSSPCPLHGPATADGTVAPRRVDTAPALAASAMSQPQQVISFADSLRLPLEEPLLRTAPRVRVSKDVDDWWVPRRSDRLAAKSAFRDPQPEKWPNGCCSTSGHGDQRRRWLPRPTP